jgi:hypothetical protein
VFYQNARQPRAAPPPGPVIYKNNVIIEFEFQIINFIKGSGSFPNHGI